MNFIFTSHAAVRDLKVLKDLCPTRWCSSPVFVLLWFIVHVSLYDFEI